MALMREDSSEREDAVDALGESKRPEAIELLSLALEDADEDVREAAVVLTIGGSPVRFCTPEDLILHKIVSERERDLADARGVTLRRIKSLDLAYLDSRIRELADALERPEIWHSWEKWKEEAEALILSLGEQ